MIGITNNWLKLHGYRTKRKWPRKRKVPWKGGEGKRYRRKADWKFRKLLKRAEQCRKSGEKPVILFEDELHAYRNR